MSNSTLSLTFLSLLVLFSFNSGGMLKFSYGFDKTWCVPKPSTTDAELEANINFACAEVGALGQSCMMIQQRRPMLLPQQPHQPCISLHEFLLPSLEGKWMELQLQGFWTNRFYLSQLQELPVSIDGGHDEAVKFSIIIEITCE